VSVATGLDIEALYQQYRVRIFRAIAGVWCSTTRPPRT